MCSEDLPTKGKKDTKSTNNMATTANQSSINELIAEVHLPKSCSQVYRGIWKTFKDWVDRTYTPATRSDDGKYLTRYNVDRFFLHYVITKAISPKSA